MTLRFSIHYRTDFGQRLCICGSLPQLGSWDAAGALSMTLVEGDRWEALLEIPAGTESFEYKYLVQDDRYGNSTWEWGGNRSFEPDTDRFVAAEARDTWRSNLEVSNALHSTAFTSALMRRDHKTKTVKRARSGKDGVTVRFLLSAPRIDAGHVFAVVGSDPALGAWDDTKALILSDARYPLWEAEVVLKHPEQFVSYKYAIYDATEKKVVTWDEGDNRWLNHNPMGHNLLHVQADDHFRYPLGNWKGAGVALPVFSLRSKQGTGVGEFADLRHLTDWAVRTGLKLVQVLPVNDTVAIHKWTDSYPYAAVSVYALHPIYLNLQQMGEVNDPEYMALVSRRREELNALNEVDYEAVMRTKSVFYKKLYDQERKKLAKDKAFQAFVAENGFWLKPYAVFSYMRDLHSSPDFTRWKQHSIYEPAAVEALCNPENPDYEHIEVHYFIQYHADKQLREAADYARAKGVVLKGDIPIGIYRYSCDAWVAPHLYNMSGQAGAPPDDFAVSGQNWGFPTYNWDEMAKDGFAWWKARLTTMSRYFDAFRIDHILGFFRIWEIPIDQVEGLLGRFNPAIPYNRDELRGRGIAFDYDRLVKPYIREHFLWERFGSHTDEVRFMYLDEYFPGCYTLKPHVRTQRQVEEEIARREEQGEDKDKLGRIRSGLYGIINEVLLIEHPFSNGEAFHPRISLHQTQSYRDLDAGQRAAFDALHTEYFFRRQDDFWREQAMKKLPALVAATDMLICGEDLGMIPKCVAPVMKDLGMLTLEIQRMPKGDSTFGHPADAPYLSVVSPSCHDMSTIRGWWEEDRTKIQQFYNTLLGHWGEAPFFCEPWVVKDVVVQHLYSPAMWAIFPIQDLVAMDGELRRTNPKDEQINVPANPKHYWRYRFHLPIEELLTKDGFNDMVLQLVRVSGRAAAY